MSWRRYSYYEFFPRSVPRKAKGGIKAQSKRGTFGESWWAKRWIAVLESFDIGARLDRGRSYARRGQVLDVEVKKGRVTAKVQGSRPTPYDISIAVKTLSSADWKKLANVLSGQAVFAAKLLAGEMPQDIEKAFKDTGLSLFPEKLRDLTTECSCPDWSNPCKHIAAVYYLLGEEFDRDPFLLFKLRGMTRQELVELIGVTEGKTTSKRSRPGAIDPTVARPLSPQSRVKTATQSFPPPEPLPVDARAFWDGNPVPDDLFGEVRTPATPAALPKRLGNFPFWRAEEPFLATMEQVYRDASAAGLDVFIGGQRFSTYVSAAPPQRPERIE